tara:strand:+ start:73 stop:357 length:285 start_codon:yes stop_codon:yes gene_type:complete
METDKTISKKSKWKWLIIGVLIGFLISGLYVSTVSASTCAQKPCTTGSPCMVGTKTYRTGSVCAAEASKCGLIGRCDTNVDPKTNKPHCDCDFL